MYFGGELILFILIIFEGYAQTADLREVERLVKLWSPLIWMSPEEKYFPLSAEEFINNVYVSDENGIKIQNRLNYKTTIDHQSKSYHLVPHISFENLKINNTSFLFGKDPNLHSIPIYALVNHCRPYGSKGKENVFYKYPLSSYNFHVSYWVFFPYNEGKNLCFVGKLPTPRIFNKCLGHLKTMGNHIGDWEHMSLSFAGKKIPDKLFLAVHDAGVYYSFDEARRYFKYESKVMRKGVAQVPTFPQILRTQGHHPVIFSANGSHGLWASPGEYDFIKVPRLKDLNGFGIPWKTWNNVKIYHLGRSKLPDWMTFGGKWGNPRKNCILLRKLGLCEFTDGPVGILRKKQDFSC